MSNKYGASRGISQCANACRNLIFLPASCAEDANISNQIRKTVSAVLFPLVAAACGPRGLFNVLEWLQESREKTYMRAATMRMAVLGAFLLSGAAIAALPVQNGTAPGGKAESARLKIAHPEVPRIAALEVKQLTDKKADFVIIDTQPAENYLMWHIPAAVNIPYISTANPTDRELMLVALPMNKLIVIYCLCEEGTDSARMALELKRLGYDDDKVKVLEGGLIKWDERGYPMIKTETPQ
jgi:rhodanese-related sulfurtransferase